jgi:cytochrome c556
VGLVGRARVKLLAARDALVWLSGDFEEPDGMNTPLLDADCRQCHATFDETPSGAPRPGFHELPVHNNELGRDCVDCHQAHEPGDADFHFLDLAHVRRQCADCHNEFAN